MKLATQWGYTQVSPPVLDETSSYNALAVHRKWKRIVKYWSKWVHSMGSRKTPSYFLLGVCGCLQAAARVRDSVHILDHYHKETSMSACSRSHNYSLQSDRWVQRCCVAFTFAKSRTSNRSKASNNSLFLRWNFEWQMPRNVSIFFRHKN